MPCCLRHCQTITAQHCQHYISTARSTFHECFSAGSAFPLPPLLQQYLQRLQELLLDGPALASGSQLYSIMTQGVLPSRLLPFSCSLTTYLSIPCSWGVYQDSRPVSCKQATAVKDV